MVEPEGWWSQATLDGMRAEFDSGKWKEKDDLLEASLEMVDDFHWQSHTMSHLARDDLGVTDCNAEDGGKRLMRRIDARPPGGCEAVQSVRFWTPPPTSTLWSWKSTSTGSERLDRAWLPGPYTYGSLSM